MKKHLSANVYCIVILEKQNGKIVYAQIDDSGNSTILSEEEWFPSKYIEEDGKRLFEAGDTVVIFKGIVPAVVAALVLDDVGLAGVRTGKTRHRHVRF